MSQIQQLEETLSITGSDFGMRGERSDPLTLAEARQFSDATEHIIVSTEFSNDGELFGLADRVLSLWPDAEVLFGGSFGEYGYIDTMYIVYDDVEEQDNFEMFAVLRFKDWMDVDRSENKGICPFCSNQIAIDAEAFDRLGTDCLLRSNLDDDSLWSAPDEFDFMEYPAYGKTVRMWWDD